MAVWQKALRSIKILLVRKEEVSQLKEKCMPLPTLFVVFRKKRVFSDKKS
jgi:hypothetical protein